MTEQEFCSKLDQTFPRCPACDRQTVPVAKRHKGNTMDCRQVLERILGSATKLSQDELSQDERRQGELKQEEVRQGELRQVAEFLNGLVDPRSQMQMCCVLSWGLSLKESQKAKVKLVGGYTNQPPGYDQVPTLLLAVRANGKAKPNEWFLRIPLKTPLTVTLPAPRISNSVTESEIARGTDPNYRPVDLADFLNRPSHYTTLS